MVEQLRVYLREYTIEPITPNNFHVAMSVFETNENYFRLTGGKDATDDDCLACINSCPDGFDAGRKRFLRVDRQGVAVCVLDFLEGYPAENIVWIGLLMVRGDAQCAGIGRDVTAAVRSAAKVCGYAELRLAVAGGNDGASAFWARNGFTPLAHAKATALGHTVDVLTMALVL